MPALKAIDDDRVIAFRLLKTIATWSGLPLLGSHYIFPKKGNFDHADQTDFYRVFLILLLFAMVLTRTLLFAGSYDTHKINTEDTPYC